MLQSFLESVKTGELRGEINLIKMAIAYEYKLIPLPYIRRAVKKNGRNLLLEVKRTKTSLTELSRNLVLLGKWLESVS